MIFDLINHSAMSVSSGAAIDLAHTARDVVHAIDHRLCCARHKRVAYDDHRKKHSTGDPHGRQERETHGVFAHHRCALCGGCHRLAEPAFGGLSCTQRRALREGVLSRFW